MIPIDGMTLLKATQMQTPTGRIIAIIFGVIIAIIIVWITIKEGHWLPCIAVLLLDVFMIFVCIGQIIEGPYLQYKVRIDDYEALLQIVEHYEIVKSEGDIWYLKEKDGK